MADELRIRILVNLFGKPVVVVPFLGSLAAFASATVMVHPAIPLFGGVVGLLVTAGVVGYRVLFDMDTVREGVANEMKGQNKESRERTLDELYERLHGDNDPHTEEQLDALRTLDDAFAPDKPVVQSLNAFSSMKIREGVNELFGRSIKLLEESLRLYHSARGMPAGSGDELLQVRREMLLEVDKNIESLTRTLAGLHRLSVAQLQTDQHDSLRQELEDNLDTALQADALSRGGTVVALDSRRERS
ncbi:hypothetical protein EBS80_04265 [bacterium]|nr:hypothetical protein [bacterium]